MAIAAMLLSCVSNIAASLGAVRPCPNKAIAMRLHAETNQAHAPVRFRWSALGAQRAKTELSAHPQPPRSWLLLRPFQDSCGHCPCLANPLTGIAMLSPSLSTLLQAAMLWVWLIMQSGGPPPLLLALALAVGLGGPIALQAFFLDTCLATRVELRGLEGLKYRCKNA